ncbi:MAG: GNAT family N-acetyltransferase [Phycisphaerales bacterium]|nr:MAG: GNAT family N-acetyltransferase [Phycisphaerales bacterium]
MPRRPIQDSDREAIAEFIEHHWHGRKVISRGKAYYPHQEEGFVDWRDSKIVGLLTYIVHGDAMEVLTLNSTLKGEGIGTALTLMAIDHARENNIKRIWLSVTNDNLPAIGFYQRLGFRMVQVNIGAVDKARKAKPQIPDVGHHGIPIHDEIVMELPVKPLTCRQT